MLNCFEPAVVPVQEADRELGEHLQVQAEK